MKFVDCYLTLNRACNNRCTWCYAQADYRSPHMDLELASNLINIAKDLEIKSAILIGGEPTVYPHLKEIVQLTTASGITPMIATNGRRFSDYEYAKSMVDSGLNAISISLKGLDSEQYKRATKRDGFDEVKKAFQNLNELGAAVHLSLTLVEDIIDSVPNLVKTLNAFKAESIFLDCGLPYIVDGKVSAKGIPSPKQLAKTIIVAKELLEDSGIEYAFRISIPMCLFPENIKHELIESERIHTCCHIQNGTNIVFDPEGNVLPCNAFTAYPLGKYSVDFTTASEFRAFWDTGAPEMFREKSRCYPSEDCIKCTDWSICGGGCLVQWMGYDPKQYIQIGGVQ